MRAIACGARGWHRLCDLPMDSQSGWIGDVARKRAMATAVLTISSKNYSSWSLRGWLLARFSGLPFEEQLVPPGDPDARAEILLL
jgi:hypothetical protein